ncbi:MAG: helix-turn-helix domain-containing protein [Parvibaculum sp.]|uniref:winged helix-turn-helix transcriptional regulator n=1 Tax=Parvibaculum sp. TaxID=2024848 RepID=UPI00283BE298|nr:helix-turn-helix domain-containing protein [Parvibaculum sp.]MDR3500893.1 helix-turn-helix domain-containing protein [Parvibaculum sp.]
MLGRNYPGQICSAASALELVGERWSLLILRDAFFRGHTRFSDFERSLGIAPNILTKRLETFLANGLMEVRTEPGAPREYLLTEKGRALKAVIISLNDWGDRWLRPGPIDYIHRNCGGLTRQVVICECCATEVPLDEVGVRPRKL